MALKARTEAQQRKGYDEVERQGPQAAHQPRQVVHDVALLAQAVVGVLQQDAEAVQGVSQDNEGKQEVGHPLGWLSLVLKKAQTKEQERNDDNRILEIKA